MMKSKPYLKSSARLALPLSLILLACLLNGCSSSTEPTFLEENIPDAIQDICKKEYKIEVLSKLVGRTLWIYLPLEDVIIPSDKPEKYIEKFNIKENKSSFKEGAFSLEYSVKAIPDKEKTQEFKYDKTAAQKINEVWRVIRRVLFSADRSGSKEPQFICVVTADIKNSFEVRELTYYQDLKKVSYDFISWGEYQHRSIQDSSISADIFGDKEGKHVIYKDITLQEFIAEQMRNRIKLKFQKPEVEKNVDLDKEIMKIATLTIKIYDLKDFTEADLINLSTNNKITLSQAAIWARPIEK